LVSQPHRTASGDVIDAEQAIANPAKQ